MFFGRKPQRCKAGAENYTRCTGGKLGPCVFCNTLRGESAARSRSISCRFCSHSAGLFPQHNLSLWFPLLRKGEPKLQRPIALIAGVVVVDVVAVVVGVVVVVAVG